MEDLFGDDAWGEEPDWAKTEDEDVAGGGEEHGNNGLVGAQHVLLLIDCHPSMFGDESPVSLALELSLVVLKQFIRDTVTFKIGKRNGIGILLYNTKKDRDHQDKKESESNDYKEHDDDDDDDDEDDGDDDDDDDDDSIDQGSTVHELLSLAPPGVKQVQTIRSFLKEDRDFRQEFCCEEEGEESRIAPLQTAIEESVRIFRNAKCVKDSTKPGEPVDSRSIWIFTNRENPYSSSSHLIKNVAREAKEQGIQIVVWPLLSNTPPPRSSLEFAWEPFFSNIISEIPFEHRLQSLNELQDGLDELQRYGKKVRRLYWGPMWLADWKEHEVNIMIDWFRFVQMQKKPAKTEIDQQTKRETIKVTHYQDYEGSILGSKKRGASIEERSKPQPGLTRIRQFAKFGGQLIPLSEEDQKEILHQANGRRDKTGLILLGFKPKGTIPSYHTMAPAYFIYPNDEVVKGSREAFVELHSAMLRKNVVAIGEVIFRLNWEAKLVLIYPVEEVFEELTDDPENLRQKRPPGMAVVELPFEDDMRALEIDEIIQDFEMTLGSRDTKIEDVTIKSEGTNKLGPEAVTSAGSLVENGCSVASEELVTAAMELVDRLKVDEGMELGEDFANCSLIEFFNYLESVALELPASEEVEEFDTRLDESRVLGAAHAQIEQFKDCLPEDIGKKKSAAARKRKVVADDSGINWEELYRSDALEDCTLPDLKKYLRAVGEKLSGKKADIISRVTEHIKVKLEKKQNGDIVKMET